MNGWMVVQKTQLPSCVLQLKKHLIFQIFNNLATSLCNTFLFEIPPQKKCTFYRAESLHDPKQYKVSPFLIT